MVGRNSIGMAALDVLASRCSGSQQRFEEACEARGIGFEARQQIGGIEWVCPETAASAHE